MSVQTDTDPCTIHPKGRDPVTKYELRRDGRVWVSSPIPDCGYDKHTLRSLRDHGFRLYKVETDGREEDNA